MVTKSYQTAKNQVLSVRQIFASILKAVTQLTCNTQHTKLVFN